MRHVGIQLIGRVVVLAITGTFADSRTAVVAVIAADVILIAATRATVCQFATRHGHKRSMTALDDLKITNDKTIVKGDGAKSTQAVFGGLHEFDPNLGYIHATRPHAGYSSLSRLAKPLPFAQRESSCLELCQSKLLFNRTAVPSPDAV